MDGNDESREIVALREAAAEGDASAAMDLALLLKHEGDESGMLAAFTLADRLGSVDGSGALGIEYARLGRLGDAEAAFDRCVEGGGERATAERTLVRIRREVAGPDEITTFIAYWCVARDLLPDTIRSLTPDQAAALHLCAEVEEHVDLDRLNASYPEAFAGGAETADKSGSAEGAFVSAVICQNGGDAAGAARAFSRAAERGKHVAWIPAARALMQTGDVAGARQAVRACEEAGVEVPAELLAELQGPHEHGEAGTHPKQILAGAHQMREAGQLAAAQNLYSAAINSGDPAVIPSAHLNLAIICEAQGNLGAAAQHYREATRSGDRDIAPLGRFNHAKMVERSGRVDDAITEYIQIAETTRHPWAAPWAAHDAAVLLMKERHAFQEGVRWYRVAHQLAQQLGNDEVEARATEALDIFRPLKGK